MANKPVDQNSPVTGAEADVRFSKPEAEHKPGVTASADVLAKALEESNALLAKLKAENEQLKAQATSNKKSSEDPLERLANLLTTVIANNNNQQGPTEEEKLNKASDFNNQRMMVDSRSLAEAQVAVSEFRAEPKVPVIIAKSYANKFGPSVAVSVNGIRVSVPCDGKMYMINQTHALHIQERIAKVESYEAIEGGVVTITA